ncbi:MAG TPA: cation diffusion facilitator family transporter [Patescibacteria group bacterium]|nr:cation diffusion facilitator family transporter [Patescibacteria group bacterium]
MTIDHNQLKKNTARLSIISNTSLVILKLVVGVYSGSVSIVSEAAHSGVDLLAAMVAFYAVRKAGKPPDEQHAYGHGKIENLSAVIEAVLIIVAALWIVYEALEKLTQATKPEYLEWGIVVMFISVIVNYWVSGQLYKVARQTESAALEADALHLRADIWTSIGVLGGLAVIKLTGLYWLDPAIALAVAVVVFKAGFEMTKKGMYELTDVCWPAEEETELREIVLQNPDTISVHNVRTRRSGSWRLVDMHVTLKKNMQLEQAHGVCDQLEAAIKERFGRCDVVIHLEPCDHHGKCIECPAAPQQCKEREQEPEHS